MWQSIIGQRKYWMLFGDLVHFQFHIIPILINGYIYIKHLYIYFLLLFSND